MTITRALTLYVVGCLSKLKKEKNGLEDFQGGEGNCNYWAREFEGLNICLAQW